MNICTLKSVLEILTGIFALAAAGWWFAAAWVSRLPPTWDSLNSVARKQTICNGIAATCAGLAAIFQLVATSFMPVCRAFS
jgi:hypothetical protein